MEFFSVIRTPLVKLNLDMTACFDRTLAHLLLLCSLTLACLLNFLLLLTFFFIFQNIVSRLHSRFLLSSILAPLLIIQRVPVKVRVILPLDGLRIFLFLLTLTIPLILKFIMPTYPIQTTYHSELLNLLTKTTPLFQKITGNPLYIFSNE